MALIHLANRATACATPSTSSSLSAPARNCGGPGPALRGAVPVSRRAHAIVRHRPGRRRSTTASAARPLATCSRSCRRPRASTSRGRWSYWPTATASSSSRSTRIPAKHERRHARERLLRAARAHIVLLRALPVGVHGGRARSRVSRGSWAGRGNPEGVPCRLRAERVGSCAARFAPRRLQRGGAVRDRAGAALAGDGAACTTASARASCSRSPTCAGACSDSARARCATSSSRST